MLNRRRKTFNPLRTSRITDVLLLLSSTFMRITTNIYRQAFCFPAASWQHHFMAYLCKCRRRACHHSLSISLFSLFLFCVWSIINIICIPIAIPPITMANLESTFKMQIIKQIIAPNIANILILQSFLSSYLFPFYKFNNKIFLKSSSRRDIFMEYCLFICLLSFFHIKNLLVMSVSYLLVTYIFLCFLISFYHF